MIGLKDYKISIVIIGVLLFLITSCSNGVKNEGNEIVVQKRVGEEDKYDHFKEINDNNEVLKIKNILDSIRWENAEVSMAYAPHFKFYFDDVNKEDISKGFKYDLWISPNKDKVELVIEGEGKYVQLSKRKSAQLFKAITGQKLANEK